MADDDLDPCTAGYLAGGSRRAVHTAVAVLRHHDAVAVAMVGKIKRTGRLPHDVRGLPSAVHSVLASPAHARAVEKEQQTRQCLDAIRTRLVQAGLLVSPTRRGLLGVLTVVVFCLGIAWLVVTPFAWLSLVIVAASTAAAGAAWRIPRRTPAGARTLRALRDRYPEEDEEPEAMMVALHGRLDLAGIENITVRPRPRHRRRDDDYPSDNSGNYHSSVPLLGQYGAPH